MLYRLMDYLLSLVKMLLLIYVCFLYSKSEKDSRDVDRTQVTPTRRVTWFFQVLWYWWTPERTQWKGPGHYQSSTQRAGDEE